MKKVFTLFVALTVFVCAYAQFVVEWNKIVHWAGDGSNKAALLVQFNDGKIEECYVWGYRWDPATIDASGEDMFRTVATECNDLLLFTQYTGWMGNTVCGIGYSKGNGIVDYLSYDFDGAESDDNISFDYWTPNELMGQTIAPGADTQGICENAILLAADTHIIDHPINARDYGYAAYDYDWWQPKSTLPFDMRWNAGWYKGYWSYWVGGVSSESLSYSGLGMTSRKLTDECVDAWCYNYIDGEYIDGITGATAPSHKLNYTHINESTGIQNITVDNTSANRAEVYNLNGRLVATSTNGIAPGIYIVKKNNTSYKLIIK